MLVVGAFAVLAVGSYATADSGKKNVDAGTMSGYLREPRAADFHGGNRVVRGDDQPHEHRVHP